MVCVQVVGSELRRDAAPPECEPGSDHREGRLRSADQADRIGGQREDAEADQREGDHLVADMCRRVRRRAQRRADHAEHDRAHRDVLAAARVLVQHAPSEVQKHEQAGRERRLDDDQRREQERHDLQRKAEDRNARAREESRAFEQVARQGDAQVLVVRRPLGVHRLQRYP
jgi:hypothetical protein